MANPSWPRALQENPNASYTEAIADNVVRSNMDAGPSQSRPRFTKTRILPRLSIWVDRTQYIAFFRFYNETLMQGCLAFDWYKPTTGEKASLKFTKPPTIITVGPLNWEIQCEFEEV
ncbi:hypothetical protein UFOVP139_50 [uncultured Caudovirales phage]|uniref:Uncharacterized protein n=1 Tax=uncultured Caudovirales phage TaxID=2100421 RepID=A0A6J5LE14_9CAUD|nr:hypothetical protein UFOVP139_50 [uncultured Caudovirales phage]